MRTYRIQYTYKLNNVPSQSICYIDAKSINKAKERFYQEYTNHKILCLVEC
jgi:hypothetical protein